MTTPTHWVHDLDPVAIRFSDRLAIRYYGLAYALAFVVWVLLLRLFHRRGKSPLSPEQQVVTMTVLIFGVFVGGRLGFVVLEALGEAIREPALILQVWRGGMSSYGALAGVALGGWCLARKFRIPLWRLADVLCPLAPPALLLGRVANFINGEGWGRGTTLPWAVIFPRSAPPGTPVECIVPRHPVQLYEAALGGLALLVWSQWRFWRTDVLARRGRLTGEFLVLYAAVRVLCELVREASTHAALGLNPSMLCAWGLGLIGAVLIVRSRRRAGPGREAAPTRVPCDGPR